MTNYLWKCTQFSEDPGTYLREAWFQLTGLCTTAKLASTLQYKLERSIA